VSGFERAVAFERAYGERLVDEVVPGRHGRGLFTPRLPLVRYLNHYSVDLGARPCIEALTDEADVLHAAAGLPHRKIAIDDDLGAELRPTFVERGWKHEELLVMPHGGAHPEVDTSGVQEVGPAELEPVWIDGMQASPEIESDEEIRQLVAAQHRRRQAVDVRYFSARVGGEIASYCELFSDGQTGQIESVMTLEPFRRRGLAQAVVSRALAASHKRHDFTFLVADASDWPKELYRKLGFESVGSIWDFVLLPTSRDASGAP
jgi:ribosomal protein S18 acetylase RimI-like enzyme